MSTKSVVPDDRELASFSLCTGKLKASDEEISQHVAICHWCKEWIAHHIELQRNSINERSWATGYQR